MILIPLLPFISVIVIGGYFFYTSIKSMTVDTMHRVLDDHHQMIESFLEERKTDLNWIGEIYHAETLSNTEQLKGAFEHLRRKSSAFSDFGFFDSSGVHLAYCGPYELSGKNYKDALWFREVLKKGVYVSDIFMGYRQTPHFIIAVVREDGSNRWVLRASIDTHFFTDLVKNVRIGKTGEAYILNHKGYFQTERRSGGALMSSDPDYERGPEFHSGVRTFLRKSVHEEYLYATSWMKNNEWLLIVRQEKADAFKMLRIATYMIIVIAAIGGMLIIPLAFYLTNRIVLRMEKIDSEKGVLEQQLIGASRLAELGEMAAGFAHEINNPLQIMKSEQVLVNMVLDDLINENSLKPSDNLDQLKDSLDQIHLQINRCAKITQAILKFGRQGEPSPQEISLARFIPEVTAMVEKRAKVENINISQTISPGMPEVFGDPSQLQQVILNLYNNAIDAILAKNIRENDEIRIRVKQSNEDNVEISVTDTGSGIESSEIKKIFTPFYTTKPVGKGTGLGLSVCYGIVEHLGGKLSVLSKKGTGSTFIITLPSSH
jgi:two-component system, NtrC family, sensor kinase